jgi:hypothetical protein
VADAIPDLPGKRDLSNRLTPSFRFADPPSHWIMDGMRPSGGGLRRLSNIFPHSRWRQQHESQFELDTKPLVYGKWKAGVRYAYFDMRGPAGIASRLVNRAMVAVRIWCDTYGKVYGDTVGRRQSVTMRA